MIELRYSIRSPDSNERFVVLDHYTGRYAYDGDDFQLAIAVSMELNYAEIAREPKTSVPSIQRRDPTIRRPTRKQPHEISGGECALRWEDPQLYRRLEYQDEFNDQSVPIIPRKR